jgi:hypothetical protein
MPKSSVGSTNDFDHATLEEAKKVILGTSEWFRFDEKGELLNLRPDASPDDDAQVAEALGYKTPEEFNSKMHGGSGYVPMNSQKQAFIYAAASLLLKTYEEQGSMPAPQMAFSTLAAPGTLHHLSLQSNDQYLDPGYPLDRYRVPFVELSPAQQVDCQEQYEHNLSSNMERLEDDLARLTELKSGILRDDAHRSATDEYDEDDYYIPPSYLSNTKHMIEHCLQTAREVRYRAKQFEAPDDYLRFSNQFPQAAKFVENSKETDFLFSSSQPYRVLNEPEEIISALTAEWLPLVKYVRLNAAPELIQATRAELLGQVARS